MKYDHQQIVNDYAKIISAHLINDDNKKDYELYCIERCLEPSDILTNAMISKPHPYAIAMALSTHLQHANNGIQNFETGKICGHSGVEVKGQSVCWDLQTK